MLHIYKRAKAPVGNTLRVAQIFSELVEISNVDFLREGPKMVGSADTNINDLESNLAPHFSNEYLTTFFSSYFLEDEHESWRRKGSRLLSPAIYDIDECS